MPSSDQIQQKSSPLTQTDGSVREQQQKAFRQYLRQADKYIVERQFDLAKRELEEAKKMDPRNPFILAFEERIALFAGRDGGVSQSTGLRDMSMAKRVEPQRPAPEGEHNVREQLEKKLRQQIETEYKAKFTNELRKAEELAAKILQEERNTLETQRQTLKLKFEQHLAESRKQIEKEFQQHLDEEIVRTEQRLNEQHQRDLALRENELKTQLAMQYHNEETKLRQQFESRTNELLEKERQSFRERESVMREEFNKKLLDALRTAETLFREQSVQQQQLEQDRLRQELSADFVTQLDRERTAFQRQYETLKASMEEAFQRERERLKVEGGRAIEARLAELRRHDAEELEQKRITIRQELEAELTGSYDERLSAERSRLQSEATAAIEAEKQRLQREFEAFQQKQNEHIKKVRIDLQHEMEENFLRRLEQIAQEYDNKMELLGARIPDAKEDRVKLYRERMRGCYVCGQPSVEGAKMLMQLKELLELTFDEHLLIESDVRLELYVESVEQKIVSGELSATNTEAFDNLKQQFRIASDEAARLEPYILSSFQRLATKGRILAVDDDELLIRSIQGVLSDAGYQVVTALDVKTALEKLKTDSVDLILSDIKFPNEELDGFKFFRAVQEQPHLRSVPFLFMSSLQDGVIVRSGVQLGADDYLTKPVDPELLVAVIEGKLKRYRSIHRD